MKPSDIGNAFDLTIKKLNAGIESLRTAIMQGDWAKAEAFVKTLRFYPDCFYCVKFRSNLKERGVGVCGSCPCHRLGEKILQRPRACNGCYVVQPYALVVKNAYWFEGVKSTESASAVLRSLEELLAFMQENQTELRDA